MSSSTIVQVLFSLSVKKSAPHSPSPFRSFTPCRFRVFWTLWCKSWMRRSCQCTRRTR
jgi:hypothetical protein